MNVSSSTPPPATVAAAPQQAPLPLPNLAISALATASGVDSASVALALAAVLGGIAGPDAGIQRTMGDLVHPGMNIVTTGQDSASWHRLEELLLGPVAACQRTLRGISRATRPERLDHLEYSQFNDRTRDIVDNSKTEVFSDLGRPQPFVHSENHLSVLRTPTVFLRLPDELTWNKALPELMRASALIWDDGSLFTRLLAKAPAKGSPPFPAQLVDAATGCDRFIERGKQDGPGRIDTVKAHLFITSGRDQVRDALASDRPVLQRLLRNCVFIDPPREKPNTTLDRNGLRFGYEAYLQAVKSVLHARRNGPGYQIAPKPDILTCIDNMTQKIQTWCDDLPPRLRPFFTDSLSLPYRLWWAFSATRAVGEFSESMVPFLWHTLTRKLWRQKKFLEDQIIAAEAADNERARQIMLQKLLSIAPCPVRELLRRYSNQRRELHQPVLDALVHDGIVRLREDGHLELADARRNAP